MIYLPRILLAMVMLGLAFGTAMAEQEMAVGVLDEKTFAVVRLGGSRIDLYRIEQDKIILLDSTVVASERSTIRESAIKRDIDDPLINSRRKVENRQDIFSTGR